MKKMSAPHKKTDLNRFDLERIHDKIVLSQNDFDKNLILWMNLLRT
jgi:hypothetical protein